MRATKLQDFSEGSEVAGLTYEPNSLRVSLGVGGSVVFDNVLGFRVLDEADLLEFWPHCSAQNGGLFQIDDGGWLSQESARDGFLSRRAAHAVFEFFITGPNSCVNVITDAKAAFKLNAL